jgi:hypothetical protein
VDYKFPVAQVGVHYAYGFTPTGTKPFEFFPNTSDECLASGPECVDLKTVNSAVPNGMYFTRDGVLQGIPKRAGTYTFKLVAKNVAGLTEQTAQLVVLPNPRFEYFDPNSDLLKNSQRQGEEFDLAQYKFDQEHNDMFDSLLGRYGHNLDKYGKWSRGGGVDDRSRSLSSEVMFIIRVVSIVLLIILLFLTFIGLKRFNSRRDRLITASSVNDEPPSEE